MTSIQSIVAAAASAGLFVIVLYYFSERPVGYVADNPASALPLSSIVARDRIRIIGAICGFITAATFFSLTVEQAGFAASARAWVQAKSISIIPDATETFNHVPAYYDPVIVLVGTLLLSLPIIRTPISWFRGLVFSVSGFETNANEAARVALASLIEKYERHSYVRQKIEEKYEVNLPMREDMTSASPHDVLSFQILYLNGPDIYRKGTKKAISDFLKEMGLPQAAYAGALPEVSLFITAGGILLYAILSLFFVFFAPDLGAALSRANTNVWHVWENFEWDKDHPQAMLSVIQYSLTFILPLAAGVWLSVTQDSLSEMIKDHQKSNRNVTTVQVIIAVTLTALFYGAEIMNIHWAPASAARKLEGNPLSFLSWRFAADLSTAALLPSIGLLLVRRWRSTTLVCVFPILFGALVIGTAFCCSRYLFEYMAEIDCSQTRCVRPSWRGYYWYSFILGTYLMFVFGLVSTWFGLVPIRPRK